MRQDGRDELWQPSMQDTFNIGNGLCNVLGACVTPFLRNRCGRNYPGVAALWGFLLMLLVAGLGPVPGMIPYIGVWLFFLMCLRSRTLQMAKKGVVVHSRYWGDPWLALRVPFVRKVS